jgi:hypothetical protein
MEKSNQRKRVGRKSSVENIYLSGEEFLKILEISKSLGDYPPSSIFTSNISINFIYGISKDYRWKLELRCVNNFNGRFEYSIKTTSRNKIVNKYFLIIQLEEKFVIDLIEGFNS